MTRPLEQRLISAGLSAPESANKAALFDRAEGALQAMSPPSGRDLLRLFVPGRIEFLGKHTDYAGGRSLVCAIERGICMAASPRDDSTVRVHDAGRDSQVAFDLHNELLPTTGHWSNYPMTVARRIARDFPGELRGSDIAFASDLPPAAGLSSSSVLVVAIFSVLAEINRLDQREEYAQNIHSREELAGYLGAVENGQGFGSLAADRGVGTFGGSQDQTAILCCRPGRLSQYAFCPVRHERSIPLPEDYLFVIGVSGIASEKTGAAREKYNRASLLAATVIELWQQATGRAGEMLLGAASHAPDAPDRVRRVIRQSSHPRYSPSDLLARFDQFLDESTRIIPAVGDAVVNGDIEAIGPLIDRSQEGAEMLLGNQVPETIWLQRSAREFGAIAASAFGAGFGGSVWALVKANEADHFRSRWADGYCARFPSAEHALFFTTRAGPAMIRL